MRIIVTKDSPEQSRKAADIFESVIREKPDCTIGLATGSSPLGLYQELIRRHRDEGLDFSRVHTVNLDEYVGLAPDHEQSYRYFMNANLFDHINIDKANTYVARGDGDIEENIEEFRRVLARSDVDVQLLGVGKDGHLGFNEPGIRLHDHAHREALDKSTIDANTRFFASRNDVPRFAITMGVGDIFRAKRLVLIVSGHKEDAVKRLLTDDAITTQCPITLLRLHRDATVILTKELADAIGYSENGFAS